jgi:hypothetical protein
MASIFSGIHGHLAPSSGRIAAGALLSVIFSESRHPAFLICSCA